MPRACHPFAVFLLATLAFAGAGVRAQDVHKCVDKGQVTYQATPCAHDDRVLPMPPAPSASEVAAADASRQADRAALATPVPPVPGPPADPMPLALPAGDGDALDGCPVLRDDRNRLANAQSALAHPTRPELTTPQALARASAARAALEARTLAIEDALRAGHCQIAAP